MGNKEYSSYATLSNAVFMDYAKVRFPKTKEIKHKGKLKEKDYISSQFNLLTEAAKEKHEHLKDGYNLTERMLGALRKWRYSTLFSDAFCFDGYPVFDGRGNIVESYKNETDRTFSFQENEREEGVYTREEIDIYWATTEAGNSSIGITRMIEHMNSERRYILSVIFEYLQENIQYLKNCENEKLKLYGNILYELYQSDEKPTVEEIMEKLQLSKHQYITARINAIKLLSQMVFGIDFKYLPGELSIKKAGIYFPQQMSLREKITEESKIKVAVSHDAYVQSVQDVISSVKYCLDIAERFHSKENGTGDGYYATRMFLKNFRHLKSVEMNEKYVSSVKETERKVGLSDKVALDKEGFPLSKEELERLGIDEKSVNIRPTALTFSQIDAFNALYIDEGSFFSRYVMSNNAKVSASACQLIEMRVDYLRKAEYMEFWQYGELLYLLYIEHDVLDDITDDVSKGPDDNDMPEEKKYWQKKKEKVMMELQLSEAQFYRARKKAISLFSCMMFGYDPGAFGFVEIIHDEEGLHLPYLERKQKKESNEQNSSKKDSSSGDVSDEPVIIEV